MGVDGRGGHVDAFTNQFISTFNFISHNIESPLIPYYRGLSEKINFTLPDDELGTYSNVMIIRI